MNDAEFPTDASSLLAELGRKYVWWQPIGGGEHTRERIVAQVMNLGTYDDIRRLERALGPHRLAEIAKGAHPGWFTPRSWEFWKGRLSLSGYELAERPPGRSLHAHSA